MNELQHNLNLALDVRDEARKTPQWWATCSPASYLLAESKLKAANKSVSDARKALKIKPLTNFMNKPQSNTPRTDGFTRYYESEGGLVNDREGNYITIDDCRTLERALNEANTLIKQYAGDTQVIVDSLLSYKQQLTASRELNQKLVELINTLPCRKYITNAPDCDCVSCFLKRTARSQVFGKEEV